MKPLDGLTIIDLSHRLPGPMCGKILSDLGAKVIKIEDHKFKDPFLTGLFAQFDESFIDWYNALNNSKEILRFDFSNSEDQNKIQKMVKESDAVIMGIPESTRTKLKLTDDELDLEKAFVVIELLASKNHSKSLHDLNALADVGLLSLHVQGRDEKIIDPPFMPFSGITFGHKAATDLLASLFKASKNKQTEFVKTYLDEATESIFGIFWPHTDRENQRKKYLHNGKYPCYTIYQTKDGHYIALAAVEEKFWLKFCEIFEIDEKVNRFHDQDRSVFKLLSDKIGSFELFEIKSMIGSEDLCLSIIS